MMYHINIYKLSPDYKYSLKAQDPTTVVPDNRRASPFESEHYTKIGGMWTLKNEIRSPKLYEILIKIELKGYTDLELWNFYNYIKMCLNVVTRPQEYFLTAYQSIKRHSDFEEYFVPDCDQTSYSINVRIYTTLGN